MPKRPHVPTSQQEEICDSQFAPTNETGSGSQPHAALIFKILVPPPMPNVLQKLRPKQKIFRPPAPFRDVHFSMNPASHQQALSFQPPMPQPPPPPQQQPIRPPSHNPNALSQETMAAARETTSERIFHFMPTPNFRPPNQK
ncbi:hypothetical protein PIB30_013833 [Stylosanthes scabra]|uniref:Uncharacterized protein n=1 Tax=Stylosanthes scabra TaxID=79078 RepID=A0ABU6T6B5_9FABA|nr:hypothetical protein [Stylosanthes scabra]